MSEPEARRRHHHRPLYRLREFLRRLAEKCDDDEIFFMAGAIAFNLVLALFPLIVLGIGIAGYVLSGLADPAQALVDVVTVNLPQGAETDVTGLVESLTQGLLEDRAGYTIAGSIFFLWVGTRLSGSMRVALRETFDIGAKRNPIHGKLFDVLAVVVGIALLTLNLGVTVVSTAAMDFGVALVGLGDATVSFAERILGLAISFAAIWTLLVLAYRFLPSRRIRWRTASIAATFSAIAHESLKLGFSWYATEVANYGSTFGNLATVALLFFWIYYESLVFILGGQVAQVYTMRRASRLGVVSFETAT